MGRMNYEAEKQRIFDEIAQYHHEYILKSDNSQFQYDALVVDDVMRFDETEIEIFNHPPLNAIDETEIGIIDYFYFLFDEENGKIIYVFIFERNLFGKSVNIPKEYLPNDLVALRSKANQKTEEPLNKSTAAEMLK